MKHLFLLISLLLPFQFSLGHEPAPIEQLVTQLAHRSILATVKVIPLKVAAASPTYGSGFLISPDGYMITCAHVLENATTASIYLDGQTIEAQLVELYPEIDTALLKIDGTNLPHLPLGNSDTTDIGEWIISIGYPFSLQPFVARGIIGTKGILGKALLLDILVCPGSSGGPLLNLKGEVIGIVSAFWQPDPDLKGVGIAVPINQLKSRLADIDIR